MDMKIFAKRLREVRISRNVSTSKLSNAIGVNKSTILRYERAEFKSIKMPKLEAIADYLEVDVDYLIGKSDDRYTLNSLKNLLKKAQRDVDDILSITMELLRQEGLTFNGKFASQESINIIVNAIELGLEMAKRKNN